jgi:hypothetical protein
MMHNNDNDNDIIIEIMYQKFIKIDMIIFINYLIQDATHNNNTISISITITN